MKDVSNVDPALSLTIRDQGAREWIKGGGVRIKAPTIIVTHSPARRLTWAALEKHELIIEAWIKPANDTQNDAVIATLSKEDAGYNFALEQKAKRYWVRVRGQKFGENQTEPWIHECSTPRDSLTTQLTHVVFTRHANGQAHLYLNGEAKGSETVAGGFKTWMDDCRFVLANEIDDEEEHAWRGEFYWVAIYNRALSQEEIKQNFAERPEAK